jgi:LacI family transcriptional regulator
MKRRPTQSDVAQRAGVSRAVVSYVLNNVGNNQVSTETRLRVQAAIIELGYQPNAMAQSLRSGTTHTIGLLIPDMDNPHYWQIAKAVEQEVQQHDHDLLLMSSALDYQSELRGIQVLARRRVDGLVLIVSYVDRMRAEIQRLVQRQKPLVLLHGGIDEVDHIQIESEAGIVALMNHLFSQGHRRIGFICGVAHAQLAHERLTIFRQQMDAAHIDDYARDILWCGTRIEDGYRAATDLLRRDTPPTALVVINDLLAMGALRAAADLHLRVPDDVSIASFDNTTLALHVNPRLTTVALDATELGRAAARMVFQRIAAPTLPVQAHPLANYLIVRDSTGPVKKQRPRDCQGDGDDGDVGDQSMPQE